MQVSKIVGSHNMYGIGTRSLKSMVLVDVMLGGVEIIGTELFSSGQMKGKLFSVSPSNIPVLT